MVRIEGLGGRPELAGVVAGWIFDEFIDPLRISREQIFRRFQGMHGDRIPLTLVALKNCECVGTVSLFSRDLPSRPDLGPWLAALFVVPEYRERGIGRMLVEACSARALGLGHEVLYLRTEHAAGYYERLGWEQYSEEFAEGGVPTTVFRYYLKQ